MEVQGSANECSFLQLFLDLVKLEELVHLDVLYAEQNTTSLGFNRELEGLFWLVEVFFEDAGGFAEAISRGKDFARAILRIIICEDNLAFYDQPGFFQGFLERVGGYDLPCLDEVLDNVFAEGANVGCGFRFEGLQYSE